MDSQCFSCFGRGAAQANLKDLRTFTLDLLGLVTWLFCSSSSDISEIDGSSFLSFSEVMASSRSWVCFTRVSWQCSSNFRVLLKAKRTMDPGSWQPGHVQSMRNYGHKGRNTAYPCSTAAIKVLFLRGLKATRTLGDQ